MWKSIADCNKESPDSLLCYGWKIRNVLVFRIDLVKSMKIMKSGLLGMAQNWKIHVLLCDETGGETIPAFLWKRENKQCLCTSKIGDIIYSINFY